MNPYNNPKLTANAKSLRKNMTKEERHLWYDFLRDYPVRFLRQKVIGNYIVDFFCPKAKLVIELDGSQHYSLQQANKDSARTDYLESMGLMVMRFSNIEVMRQFEAVCGKIAETVFERTESLLPQGEGGTTPVQKCL